MQTLLHQTSLELHTAGSHSQSMESCIMVIVGPHRLRTCRQAILTQQPSFTGKAWQDISEPAKAFVKRLLNK